MTHMSRKQRGSVIVYLMLALALIGLLTAYLSSGSKRAPEAVQSEQYLKKMETDLALISTLIQECILTYPDAVDLNADNLINATDNPNPPFPVYDDLSTGGVGVPLNEIRCPGAPVSQQVLFSNLQMGRYLELWHDSEITTTYLNNATEGIRITITRASDSDYWSNVLEAIETSRSECSVEINLPARRLYFWVKRNPTSVATEIGCP